MPFIISCRDTGVNCPATFVSDSDIQLLDDIHRHIDEAHPDQKDKKPSPEKAQKLIKKV
jgi:predicted small metal-binding protein